MPDALRPVREHRPRQQLAVADLIGMKLGDYVVTESGFGSDMGMEKFFDIVCRFGELTPSAVVLVATVRAIKHHGGVDDDPRVDRRTASRRSRRAWRTCAATSGSRDVRRARVVAVNRRPGRHRRGGRARPRARAGGRRVRAPRSTRASREGGAGAADLAEAVVEACEQPNDFHPLYADDAPIQDKIEAVAKQVYGAADVYFYPEAEQKLEQFTRDGLGRLPGLHGQDAPVAVRRPDAAQRAGGLHAPRPRHPRLHRRRLARPAVRRHHCRCRASARRRPRSTSTSTPTAAPSGSSSGPMAFADRRCATCSPRSPRGSRRRAGVAAAAWACALARGARRDGGAFTATSTRSARGARAARPRARAGGARAATATRRCSRRARCRAKIRGAARVEDVARAGGLRVAARDRRVGGRAGRSLAADVARTGNEPRRRRDRRRPAGRGLRSGSARLVAINLTEGLVRVARGGRARSPRGRRDEVRR